MAWYCSFDMFEGWETNDDAVIRRISPSGFNGWPRRTGRTVQQEIRQALRGHVERHSEEDIPASG
jgi:hypothetical protein